jgi:ABC-type multidrug transport system fused ATPase/permease subunit
MVEQQPGLLVGKVADIVSYGNNNASKDDVLRVLEQTQAYEFVQNLPDGIDTLVGGDGVGISGGQAQRLALARALLRKPSVLILDEATSALDVHTESAVTSKYLALGDESPNVLVIAHRLSTVRNADTIVVIVDGRVEEMGSHNDLLIRHPNGVYAKLVSASSSSSSALA